MRKFLALVLILMIAGCGESIGDSVSDMIFAKNLWLNKMGTSDYTFVVVRDCYCSEKGRPIEVSVISGSTSNAVYKDDRKPANVEGMGTVPEIFQLAFSVLKNEDLKLVIQYNEELGYPERVLKTNPGVFDADLSIEILEVVPL